MTPEQTAAIIELLEAFPEQEDQLLSLFISYIFGDVPGAEYERKTRKICVEQVMKYISVIKQGAKSYTRMLNAYYDVARYQTNVIDAAIDWEVDPKVLELIVAKLPPPKATEDRLRLKVPNDVTKLREI